MSKETPETYFMETLKNMSESCLLGLCVVFVLLRDMDDNGLEPCNPRKSL